MQYVGASLAFILVATVAVMARVVQYARPGDEAGGAWTQRSAFFNLVLPSVNVLLYGVVSATDFYNYAEDKYRIALLLHERKPPTFQLMFATVPVLFHAR